MPIISKEKEKLNLNFLKKVASVKEKEVKEKVGRSTKILLKICWQMKRKPGKEIELLPE